MIIDFHTHIFPPEIRDRRDDYVQRDPTFAEMYASPKAKIATVEDLLGSMDQAGVDVSVALGFAWRDHELCVKHNDYLLEAAAQSDGRIVPFCTINPPVGEGAAEEVARCVAAGAKGLGELRPESQAWDLNGTPGRQLAELARQHGLVLLFHVTEVGGHEYPGKEGLQLGAFYRFSMEHTDLRIVGGHFGGGLPFSTTVENLRRRMAHVSVDTAARSYLYELASYRQVIGRIGPERVLLASDYPLLAQTLEIEQISIIIPEPHFQAMIFGGNAARLLKLEGDA